MEIKTQNFQLKVNLNKVLQFLQNITIFGHYQNAVMDCATPEIH